MATVPTPAQARASAPTVSRQLHAAGYLLIASADRHRRQGVYAHGSVLGAVTVGFSHHRIGATQRRLAADMATDLRALGYEVEVRDVPADHYLALGVSRAATR